jgi:hypothetical protein
VLPCLYTAAARCGILGSRTQLLRQRQTYLAKNTAAERTAYVQEIGLAQRFQALDPRDREAVERGVPRVGMSADALRFLWGEPSAVEGDARHAARWHYVGAVQALSAYGNQWYNTGQGVDVSPVHGKVVAWTETPPPLSLPDTDGRRQR